MKEYQIDRPNLGLISLIIDVFLASVFLLVIMAVNTPTERELMTGATLLYFISVVMVLVVSFVGVVKAALQDAVWTERRRVDAFVFVSVLAVALLFTLVFWARSELGTFNNWATALSLCLLGIYLAVASYVMTGVKGFPMLGFILLVFGMIGYLSLGSLVEYNSNFFYLSLALGIVLSAIPLAVFPLKIYDDNPEFSTIIDAEDLQLAFAWYGIRLRPSLFDYSDALLGKEHLQIQLAKIFASQDLTGVTREQLAKILLDAENIRREKKDERVIEENDECRQMMEEKAFAFVDEVWPGTLSLKEAVKKPGVQSP